MCSDIHEILWDFYFSEENVLWQDMGKPTKKRLSIFWENSVIFVVRPNCLFVDDSSNSTEHSSGGLTQ